MRIVFLLLFFLLTLHAKTYNSTLLDIHAKVFPKLLLTDENIDVKVVRQTIIIYIMHKKNDIKTAQKLRKNILSYYQSLKNYTLNILLQEYRNFKNEDATAYYFLHGDEEIIRNINKHLRKKSLMSFSYESEYLDYGTLMSLHIGKKVSPYINLEEVKKRSLVLSNIIYKIARVK